MFWIGILKPLKVAGSNGAILIVRAQGFIGKSPDVGIPHWFCARKNQETTIMLSAEMGSPRPILFLSSAMFVPEPSAKEAHLPKNSFIPIRHEKPLNSKLDKRLLSYAAGAAGLSMLALTQPSHAEVVFTPAHTRISLGSFPIDLNGDGITDFFILNSFHAGVRNTGTIGSTFASMDVLGAQASNRPVGYNGFGRQASALNPAVTVGSQDHFGSSAPTGMASCSVNGRVGGQWLNAKDKYLGVQFVINGQVHYGWIRFSVKTATRDCNITAHLSGYAYETEPGKALLTGKQHPGEESTNRVGVELAPSSVTVPTLGVLAHGASVLAAWRKHDENGTFYRGGDHWR